ncbi:MAG: hypothetical protein QM594_00510 [Niabella sp.]
MFDVYQELVLLFYEHKQWENNLPLNLVNPTPAKIRKECEVVCSKRFSRKDGRVLEAFFGEGSDQAVILRAIKKFDVDKFKPLIKFLRKETAATSENNIELLAWLVDFNPRPFELGKDYTCLNNANAPEIVDAGENTAGTSGVEKNQNLEEQEKVEHQPGQPPKEPSASPAKKRGFKIIAGSSIAVALALSGVFINKIKDEPPPVRSGHCMYWAGDHYEPTSCTPKKGDTLLIELDSAKLFRFKKITRPETITKDDIGRVTYIKLDGRREYYTDTGAHPVYTNKRLKPLTKFIYERHILPLKQ